MKIKLLEVPQVLAVISGQCVIDRHASSLNDATNVIYGDEEESVSHILYFCSQLCEIKLVVS